MLSNNWKIKESVIKKFYALLSKIFVIIKRLKLLEEMKLTQKKNIISHSLTLNLKEYTNIKIQFIQCK
jgi:hypothetical protein